MRASCTTKNGTASVAPRMSDGGIEAASIVTHVTEPGLRPESFSKSGHRIWWLLPAEIASFLPSRSFGVLMGESVRTKMPWGGRRYQSAMALTLTSVFARAAISADMSAMPTSPWPAAMRLTVSPEPWPRRIFTSSPSSRYQPFSSAV